jgi:hypothetical protein
LNNPLRYLDQNGRYEEDVHRDLTTALAYAAGFSLKQAQIIGTNDNRVDTVLDPVGPLGTNYSNRECCHFTTPEQREKLWNDFESNASYYGNWQKTELDPHPEEGMMISWYLPLYEHALQDSFSHDKYGPILGQAVDVRDPTAADKTYNNPAKADRMALATFNSLVGARNTMGRNDGSMARPISFGAIKGLISQWNAASDPAKKAEIMQKIMAKIENGRSIQRNDTTPVGTMRMKRKPEDE